MAKKKTLTTDQEFEIMKLVLDKLLLLGIGIVGFGLYQMVYVNNWVGLWIVVGGALFSLIFMAMLVHEYEYSK